jgi:NADH:ubiquinone oxidoreductase subunit K
MPIGLEVHFLYFVYLTILILSLSFVFFVGYNFFLVLIYLELSALAVSSILVITANYFDSFFVEFFAVLLMAVVGAESAVAISILILAANQGLDLNSYSLGSLKGLHFFAYICTL